MEGNEPEASGSGLTLFTVAQVAELFQCSEETVRAKVRAKKWPHKRLGPRIVRFTEEHLAQITGEAEVPAEVPEEKGKSRRIKDLVARL